MGIPTYAQVFTLTDPSSTGIGAPSTGPATSIPYSQICQNNWPSVFEQDQKEMYAFSGNQWISYDSPDSVQYKSEYVKSTGKIN